MSLRFTGFPQTHEIEKGWEQFSGGIENVPQFEQDLRDFLKRTNILLEQQVAAPDLPQYLHRTGFSIKLGISRKAEVWPAGR